jgi:hypothetical protein
MSYYGDPITEKPKLEVGDIIVSSNLKCCVHRDIDKSNDKGKGQLSLHRGRPSSLMNYYKKVPATLEDGTVIQTKIEATAELASVDLSRGTAKFVVISAGACGGSHGGHDDYPDGWGVTLKRLDGDGAYDPDGEEIFCYQYNSGCFIDSLYLKVFEVVGKLTKKVTFE